MHVQSYQTTSTGPATNEAVSFSADTKLQVADGESVSGDSGNATSKRQEQQASQYQGLFEKVDIWAVGCLVTELLTGQCSSKQARAVVCVDLLLLCNRP